VRFIECARCGTRFSLSIPSVALLPISDAVKAEKRARGVQSRENARVPGTKRDRLLDLQVRDWRKQLSVDGHLACMNGHR
jgi:hypothetical protein